MLNHLNVARDGFEAIDFLRRRGKQAKALRPDPILRDLNPPKKDGREIKTDPVLHRILVAILTIFLTESDVWQSDACTPIAISPSPSS